MTLRDHLICAELNEAETDVCAEMMRMCGVVSQSDLVRLALTRLADHLEMPVTRGTFRQQKRVGNTKLKARQLAPSEVA